MINNISEGTLRVASKIDPSGVIHDKEASQEKTQQVSEARPVEKSEAGSRSKKEDRRKEDGSSGFRLTDHKVVYEKYDRNGELVLRIPPSVTPVDELA